MKKGILAVLALGIGASALSGCGAINTPAPVTTVTVTPEATPEETTEVTTEATPEATGSSALAEPGEWSYDYDPNKGKVSDQMFTDLVREKTTTAYIMSNYEIVELAKNTCETYETGGDLRNVLSDISEKFLDTTANVKMDEQAFFGDLAFVTGAGVANYCGEHEEQFRSEVNAVIEEAKKNAPTT